MATITYHTGNIFGSSAQVIVNAVNCRGVMGKGLALQFKKRFPEMFLVYQQDCKNGTLRIGQPVLYTKSQPWILNFPTKDDWRQKSKLEYIEQGLGYFVAHCKEMGIQSIAFPKLGTGLGGLSWNQVGPLMVHYFNQIDADIHIYITKEDTKYYP